MPGASTVVRGLALLRQVGSAKIANTALRIVPMLAKLLLTVYAGRYLPFEDLGIYGIVFAAVMILNSLLGQSFSYVIVRELVDATPSEALNKMRDQLVLYGLNYALLAAIVVASTAVGFQPLPQNVLWFIVVLTSLEGIGAAVWSNMNAMHQQVWANAVFFVRSGLWVVPAVLLGLWDVSFRSASIILWSWVWGCVLSLLLVCYIWRYLPAGEILRSPVDWRWIFRGVSKSFPVWVGTIGLAAGVYVDRFVVQRFLSLTEVGVITFYGTFTNALIALLQAGVIAFAMPRLVRYHRERDNSAFKSEARRTIFQAAVSAAAVAICLALVVPALSLLTQRAALIAHLGVFWLMLLGVWLRGTAESLQTVLFSSHNDKPIWVGNLLFLLPAIGGNALLVPILGLSGVGISAIISGAFLLGWRGKFVYPLVGRACRATHRIARSNCANSDSKSRI